MKKTRHIKLILITAALAGCHRPNNEWQNGNRTYVRGDSTAPYTQVYHPGIGISPLLWYFAFRPYGNYYNGYYRRAGYYSNALSERGNIGGNSFKGSVVRGGFGRGGFSVSS
jgi:hypothetical protein